MVLLKLGTVTEALSALPRGGHGRGDRRRSQALGATEHDHRKRQRFLKTRYQNLPTETEAQNGAFARPFETRRPRETSQRPRIRAHFAPNPKGMKKQRLAGWGGRTRTCEFSSRNGELAERCRPITRSEDIGHGAYPSRAGHNASPRQSGERIKLGPRTTMPANSKPTAASSLTAADVAKI
jgi:hypothetical protein